MNSFARFLLPTLLLLVAFDASAQIDGAYNTTPYDSLDPGTGDIGRYSSLWGYTAPDGREYALLGGYTGTHIIDITEKPIREVAFIDGPDNGWREMKTYGEYAYVVTEGGSVGLQIIDLRQLPDTAVLLKADDSFFATGHTISQEGDWIYVHGTDVDAGYNAGTVILEVATDPQNPTYAGAYTRDYVHDAMIRNDTLYGSMINNGRLDIAVLSPNRDSVRFVTSFSYPGAGTHNSDNTIDGRYIMTSDEVGTTAKTLKVWDRSDVDDIVKVAEFTPVPEAIIHQVHTLGDLAVCAWYTAGVRIIDMSDPVNPVEVGFFDHYPGSASRYVGAWEVYPYFPSGKMIVSDTRSGLYVFTYDGAIRASASLTIVDSATGEPLEGVLVELDELGRTEMTDATGRIDLEAAAGTVNYRASLLNYRQASGDVALTANGNDITVRLVPLILRTYNVIAVKDGGSLVPIDIPIGYRVDGRPERGRSDAGQVSLPLPVDSSYTLLVQAWGYRPKEVQLLPQLSVDPIPVVLEEGYVDNADLDLGWIFGDESDDGSAGYWERAPMTGVGFNFNGRVALTEPSVDGSGEDGGWAFMTDGADSEGAQPGASDVDTGAVTLTSPLFDLVNLGLGDPTITFQLWFSNDAAPFFPSDDNLYIRLSNDDGATWVDVESVGSGLTNWTQYEVRVGEYLEPTERMRFRVVASDSLEQGWVEAGLDEFEIVGLGSVDASRGSADIAATILSRSFSSDARLILTPDNPGTAVTVDLYDGLGRIVTRLYSGGAAGQTAITIDRSELPQGAYHVVIRNEGTGGVSRVGMVVRR